MKLNNKLQEVPHLFENRPRSPTKYQLSQVSVEYLVAAISSNTDNAETPEAILQPGMFCLYFINELIFQV